MKMPMLVSRIQRDEKAMIELSVSRNILFVFEHISYINIYKYMKVDKKNTKSTSGTKMDVVL